MKITIETNRGGDTIVKIDGFNAETFCMATNEILNSAARRASVPSAEIKIKFLVLMAQILLADEDS